jgi:hypothetical protein
MNTGLDKLGIINESELNKHLEISMYVNSEVDKHLGIKIKSHHINSELYLEGVRKRLLAFDEQYSYVYKTYNNTESKLQELISNNDFTPSDNILEIKRQVDSIFSKYLPSISDGVSENTDGLDLELMDKITPLVPEGKEILLKNIVKELNGSAKGLSDFVIIFTKYRQAIINHNGIEYFQRKGCHFLRKI